MNNLIAALKGKENFVLQSIVGIGKIAALKASCEQLGLKYDIIYCAEAEDITTKVNAAVDNGAQVVIIDEANRLPEDKQKEVFQIFNRSDVKVILSVHTQQHPYYTFESEVAFEKWIKDNSIKLIEFSL